MTVFVDTSVWSLALRRDRAVSCPEVETLEKMLSGGESIFTTGLVLQELLQGFEGPKQKNLVIEKFTVLPFIIPDRNDHIEAASLRNQCRKKGLQVGTIDALLAQLCLLRQLPMLTTDADFKLMTQHCSLQLVKI